MKIEHQKGSNEMRFLFNNRTWENRLKDLKKYKGWLLDTILRKRHSKPDMVIVSYKWGFYGGKKSHKYVKSFTNKEEAERIFRQGGVRELTTKKIKKDSRFSFTLEKGNKEYIVRAVEIHDRPEYYYTSYKIPIGIKLNQKAILRFIYYDLLERYEFLAYQAGYEKPHNLREIQIRVMHENSK